MVQENGGASVVDGSDFELSEVELMTLSESREDYLENLLILETRSGGFVRQVDMPVEWVFQGEHIKAMSSLSPRKDMLNLGFEVWFAFQMGDAKSLKEFTTAIASSSRFLPTWHSD